MKTIKSALRKITYIDHTWLSYKTYPNFSEFILPYLRNSWLRIRNRLTGGLPIPDPYLVYLVAGTDDVNWFLQAGELAANSIHDTFAQRGVDINQMGAILDFGCGVGRVTRHFRSTCQAQLFGTDINESLINWCQQNLKFGQFQVNPLAGKLAYEDQQFDMIYALSVFTHLSEELQFHWLGELMRVLKPDGYLYFSTHGDYYEKELLPADLEKYRAGELVVYYSDQEGSNTCAAFHPVSYVRNKLAKDLKLITYIPEGAIGNPKQDVYVLQK